MAPLLSWTAMLACGQWPSDAPRRGRSTGSGGPFEDMNRVPGLKAVYRRLRPELQYLGPRATVRQAAALRRCFRDRVTIPRAEEEIKRALARREERFLDMV